MILSPAEGLTAILVPTSPISRPHFHQPSQWEPPFQPYQRGSCEIWPTQEGPSDRQGTHPCQVARAPRRSRKAHSRST